MRSLLFFVALGMFGCAASPPPAEKPPVAAPSLTSASSTAAEPLPTHTLHRADVHRVVAAGLGAFLQRVSLDDHPVMLQGKFHGYRVTALAGDPSFWHDVDLKPGDVVTHVNGFPIEHPEEALEAFRSLEVASEIRVEYERNGASRELRYAIVDP